MQCVFVGLGRLLSYHPKEDKEKIQQERKKLGDYMEKAESEIKQIVRDDRRKFDETVRKQNLEQVSNENAASFLDFHWIKQC